MHTPIQVDAKPFAFQAVQERLQDVVVVVSQVNVNVERRDPFHALEMTPQCAEELPLRLVSAVLWQPDKDVEFAGAAQLITDGILVSNSRERFTFLRPPGGLVGTLLAV